MHRELLVLLILGSCGGTPLEEATEPEPSPPAAGPEPATGPAPPPAAEPTVEAAPEPVDEEGVPAEQAPTPEPDDDEPAAPEAPAPRTSTATPPPPEEAAPDALPAGAATDAPAPTTEETAPAAAPEDPPEIPEDAPVRTYTLSDRSSLYVQVFKDPDTLAAGLSHDHVVKAGRVRGSFTWDPDDLAACDIQVEVPVSGLIVDPPRLREAVGLEGTLSEKQRGDVAKNMRSKAQLWADKHGTITFRSTGCAEAGDGAVRVTGDLTVRGQAARKTVTLALDAGAADLTATGSFTANATDFGFSPYSAMAGALKNRDQMRFTVKLRGSVR